MVKQQSVEDYSPPTPQVESVDGDRLSLFCGDPLPDVGSAVAIDDSDGPRHLYAVCRRHTGARRVDAWLPECPEWVGPGTEIELTGRKAGVEASPGAVLCAGPELIKPVDGDDLPLWPSAPDWQELSGERSSIQIGAEPIDALSPVCEGGLNLVIDNSGDSRALASLSRRVAQSSSASSGLVCSRNLELYDTVVGDDFWRIDAGSSPSSQIAALQLAIALAATLREQKASLAIVELPQIQWPQSPTPSSPDRARRDAIADIVGRLGRHLVSVADRRLTSLLWLQMPADAPAVETVVDTLRLGDVDATIYIDDEGRFRPERSSSSADVDGALARRRQQYLKTLQLARSADEKSAIFGDLELSDAQRQARDDVARLRPVIADAL